LEVNMTENANLAKTGYAQPKLVVYGGFSELTASGSGTSTEGAMMTSLVRRP
jgi:hypothetical protein